LRLPAMRVAEGTARRRSGAATATGWPPRASSQSKGLDDRTFDVPGLTTDN